MDRRTALASFCVPFLPLGLGAPQGGFVDLIGLGPFLLRYRGQEIQAADVEGLFLKLKDTGLLKPGILPRPVNLTGLAYSFPRGFDFRLFNGRGDVIAYFKSGRTRQPLSPFNFRRSDWHLLAGNLDIEQGLLGVEGLRLGETS